MSTMMSQEGREYMLRMDPGTILAASRFSDDLDALYLFLKDQIQKSTCKVRKIRLSWLLYRRRLKGRI